MRIDNGERRHLVIEGVFDGMAGFSRGVLAFVPNRFTGKPSEALGATLDGAPIFIAPKQEKGSNIWLTGFATP